MRELRNLKVCSSLILTLITCCQISCLDKSSMEIDISGKWNFQMDSLDVGISEQWFIMDLPETVYLPGSMTENGKGDDVSLKTQWTGQVVDRSWYLDEKYAPYRKPGNIKIPFWLQPEKHYIGPAWYQKEFNIPEGWKDKSIELFLERCHWETQVWINGNEAGLRNTLATAHRYDITDQAKIPGNNKIAIRIDNRIKHIDPGQNAHSVSDHTQTNWNGITGKMHIRARNAISFENLKITPDLDENQVVLEMRLLNNTQQLQSCKITLQAENKNHKPAALVKKISLNGKKQLKITYPMGADALLWDEFNPNVYTMQVTVESALDSYSEKTDFGLREFTVEGTRFIINGRPVFLRGTLECAIFPKTGYPPTDPAEWLRIFKVIKAHGLNHMRFHSWCPPEAAFIAADREGIYLQVECSAWATIGDGKPIDAWLYKEAEQIINDYGNHPSFCLMAYGNEPGGKNQGSYLSKFVSHWKERDDRRVYTSGAGWPPVPEMDFYNPMDPRIQRWGEGLKSIINKKAPHTTFDYKDIMERKFSDKPMVSHEIGQWCVYPNFKEIQKYSGVLKAKNFELFRETLNNNGLGHLAEDYLYNSGKLQALCYKADIEAALRTSGMAGFQLLDLHDFPGQGTALIGVLDAFWDEKGYISPQEFRAFCNKTVPLARFEKRIFRNNETLTADVELAHFGTSRLENVTPVWKIVDVENKVFAKGKFTKTDIPVGNGLTIGRIRVSLVQISKPQKLILLVDVAGFQNSWDIWVYPAKHKSIDTSKILIVQELNEQAVSFLEKGGKVLLSIKKGSLRAEYGADIKLGFSSIFWNTAWTRRQAPHTLGILCDPVHPAFNEFPTESHSNWQWWDAMHYGSALNLDNIGLKDTPVVRIIDDWFENRSLALLFEVKVGKGKLFVSGIDFWKHMENRPVAGQLLYSIQKYMLSEQFNPGTAIKAETISKLLKQPTLMSEARIMYSDNQVTGFEAENVLDDDPTTFWHTPWEGNTTGYPHEIQIELGKKRKFSKISVLPRQDGVTGGWISEAELYVSRNGKNWGVPVARTRFSFDKKLKIMDLGKLHESRYIRFVAMSGFQDQEFASVAEISLSED